MSQSKEMAEALKRIHTEAERIPDNLRADVLAIIEGTESTQAWLDLIVDTTAKESTKRIREVMDFEEETRGIIGAARQAYVLRNTEPATGLTNLIDAIKQTKERCERRKQEAQMRRSEEAMREIEAFRAKTAQG